jgi:serine/threonine protein kinase
MTSSLPGTEIGDLRVVDENGKGGTGEACVAYDGKLDRKVALRAIRAEQRIDAEPKARLAREGRFLAQLARPGIIRIFDCIEEGDPTCSPWSRSGAGANRIAADGPVDTSATKIERARMDQPEIRARLMESMGTVHRSLGMSLSLKSNRSRSESRKPISESAACD